MVLLNSYMALITRHVINLVLLALICLWFSVVTVLLNAKHAVYSVQTVQDVQMVCIYKIKHVLVNAAPVTSQLRQEIAYFAVQVVEIL